MSVTSGMRDGTRNGMVYILGTGEKVLWCARYCVDRILRTRQDKIWNKNRVEGVPRKGEMRRVVMGRDKARACARE